VRPAVHATHCDDASGSLRHRFEVATPFADVETFSPITEPADFDRFNVRLDQDSRSIRR